MLLAHGYSICSLQNEANAALICRKWWRDPKVRRKPEVSDDRPSTSSTGNEEENSVTTYSPDSRDNPYPGSLDPQTIVRRCSLYTERERDGLRTQTQSDSQIQKVALAWFMLQSRQI